MENQIIAMQQWYQAPPGDLVLALEQQQLAHVLPNFFGQSALLLGGPGDLSLLQASPIKQQVLVHPSCQDLTQASAVMAFDELALGPNSVDLIVVAHVLEFLLAPEQLLSQLYQCLAPHGHLLILGFAPLSLWGLHHRLRRRQGLPWQGKCRSLSKLDYWLTEIGYSVIDSHRFGYQGPTSRPRSSRVRTALELLGQVCWPGLGGLYLQVAQKQMATMTPIKASWWAKKPVADCRPCVP